jgi:hypothetical protein
VTDIVALLELSPFLRDLSVRWSGGELVQAAHKGLLRCARPGGRRGR